MRSKRALLSNIRLYVIADADVCGDRDPTTVALEAVAGGADLIQWRAKSWTARARWQVAHRMAEALRATPALFVVNDHLDLALAVGADGVHLGQDDLPLDVARRVAGSAMIIGQSTHSVDQALAAEAGGADYIGVGPVFATPTKPDHRAVGTELIDAVDGRITIPYVAIGGIDQRNLPLVLSHGATRVAVVRAVAGAADVRGAAHAMKTVLVTQGRP